MSKRLIYEEDAIDELVRWGKIPDYSDKEKILIGAVIGMLSALPSAQPQLEECPIYGGMCGYPSNLCYECPRHEGAKERPQWWTEGLQPFAQPQRIKGRWERKESDLSWWYECSECGESPLFDPYEHEVRTPFCPFCGSDMRGDEDAAD